jgi:hypothetical protein
MQCLARDPRQAPERFLAPISSICTTALPKSDEKLASKCNDRRLL